MRKIKDYFRETYHYTNQYIRFQKLMNHKKIRPHREEVSIIVNKKFPLVSKNVECHHNGSDMLFYVNSLLENEINNVKGVIVECGCYKGGSAAKISLIAKIFNRKMILCDTFKGMPENKEKHNFSIFGDSIKGRFSTDSFRTSLDETRLNVKKNGCIEQVEFNKGLFESTLKNFRHKIALLYIDVDLASSTKTVLRNLCNKIESKGIILSQDGDFPLVIEVFEDKKFLNNLGITQNKIEGLNKRKMIKIIK